MAIHETKIPLSIGIKGEQKLDALEKRLDELSKPTKVGTEFDISTINKFEKALPVMEETLQNINGSRLGFDNFESKKEELNSFSKALDDLLKVRSSFDDNVLTDSQKESFASFISTFQEGINDISSKLNDFPALLEKTLSSLPSLNEKVKQSLFDGSITINKDEIMQIYESLNDARRLIGGADENLYQETSDLLKIIRPLKSFLLKKDFNSDLFDKLIEQLTQAGYETSVLETRIKELYKVIESAPTSKGIDNSSSVDSSDEKEPPKTINDYIDSDTERVIHDSLQNSLDNLHLTLGTNAELDPDFANKVKEQLQVALSGVGMNVESFSMDFFEDSENGLKERIATIKAFNEETNEAITLMLRFNDAGEILDRTTVNYTNTSGRAQRIAEAKEQIALEKEIAKAEEEHTKAEEKRAKAEAKAVASREKLEKSVDDQWQKLLHDQDQEIQSGIDDEYTKIVNERIKAMKKIADLEGKIIKDPDSKSFGDWRKELQVYDKILDDVINDQLNLEHKVSSDALNENAKKLKDAITEIQRMKKVLDEVYGDSSIDQGSVIAKKVLQEEIDLRLKLKDLNETKQKLLLDPKKNEVALKIINKQLEETREKLTAVKNISDDFASAGFLGKDAARDELKIDELIKLQKSHKEKKDKILGDFDDVEIKDLDQKTNKISTYADKVKEVQNAWRELQNYVDANDLNIDVNFDEAKKKAENLKAAIKEINSNAFVDVDKNGRKFLTNLEGNLISVRGEVENLIKSYKGIDEASIRWAANQKSVTYSLKDAAGVMKQYRMYMEQIGDSVQVRTVDLGAETASTKISRLLNAGVKTGTNAVGSFIGMYADINDLIGYASKGVDVFKEYDAALTDIRYTTEGTRAQIDAMGESYIQLAKDMSSSIADSMEVASIYANLQTSSAEVMESVRPTLLLSNATGVDASDASDQIQGVLEQFDMATSEAEHIVDVYESISSNLKLDFGKAIDAVSEGVSVAGQTAADAGLTFEQLAAVIGKVAEKTRDGGSEIGNSLKTMLTRISKASSMSDEVDNETISAASAALNDIGIKVYEADGSFRNFGAIMTELQRKWEGLNDVQQSYLAYQIAATRQTNRFKVMLDSWVESMEMANDVTFNSDGYAESLQAQYEESFNGKLQKLSTTAEAFWISFMNHDMTFEFIDFLTNALEGVTNLTEKIGSLGVAMGAIFGGQGLIKLFKGEFNIGDKIVKAIG